MRIATTRTMTAAENHVRYMSVSLHFTTYFPNVSYVNSSKRPRKEDCSNEGEEKQGRRQEEKEEETKDVEDRIRERTANGRERKGTKVISSEFLV